MNVTPQISVVVPCFNEEGSLEELTARVHASLTRAQIDFELILVNDGSTDSTEMIARDIHVKHHFAKFISQETNKGIWEAWKAGSNIARAPFVCLIDADLQNLPEDIPRLYEKLLSSNTDFVQASRSEIDRSDRLRFMLSKSLNFLLNATFGDKARDNKSGFLIGHTFALKSVLATENRYRHCQTFVRVAARAQGFTFSEVETLFAERKTGKSFLAGKQTWLASLHSLLDVAKASYFIGRGRGDARHGGIFPLTFALEPTKHPYQGWRRALFELYFWSMPLHKWLITRNARNIYLQLKAAEYLTANQITEYQTEKLRRLLHHVTRHVPYYRQLKEKDTRLGTLTSLADLTKFPFLSKEDVRNNLYFDLFDENHNKKEMHKISTSGSTGQPFTTFADRFQLEVRFATTLRSLEWTGWRMGDRQARLWHQTLGMTRLQVLKEKIDALFMRRLFIPAFEINVQQLEKTFERLRKFKPVLLDGYAESLNFMANYITSGNKPGFKPLAIMSSAQALPDNVKSRIEEGFETHVFDKYGSREFSGIAYQCEKSNDHHVMSESYIVELVTEGRPTRPGEVGEVIVTDLNNYSVPLVRYRIGDLAEAVDNSVPCGCGRNQPRIGKIQGRSQAIVKCGNGTWMPGTFFAHFFKDHESAISLFQVYQNHNEDIDLKIVKGPGWSIENMDSIVNSLLTYIGRETRLKIKYVDEIPLLKTGKRSPVVSDLQVDFQDLKQNKVGKQK